MEQPTIVCVENVESGFAVSQEVLKSGLFRIITVTNPDAAAKTFSAVRADAAVLDCRVLAHQGIQVATTLREIDPSVPQFLFAPAEGATTVYHGDHSGLVYVVHDLQVLADQLRALLIDMKSERDRQGILIRESIKLRERGRDLRAQTRREIDRLKASVPPQADSKFRHITVSVCKRCGRLVAMSDDGVDVQQGEKQHHCTG